MLRVALVIDDYNELIYLQTMLKKLGFDVEGTQNPKKYADLSLGFNPQVLITTARGKKVDGMRLAEGIQKLRGQPKIVGLKLPTQKFEVAEIEGCGVDQMLDTPINPKKFLTTLAQLCGIDETALLEKYSKIKGLVTSPQEAHLEHVSYDENGQPIDDLHRVRSTIEELVTGDPKATAPKFEIDPDSLSSDSPAGPQPAKSQFPIGDHVPDGSEALEGDQSDTRSDDQSKLQTDSRRTRFEKWKKEMGPLPAKRFDRDKIREFNKKIRGATPPDDIEEIEDERRKFVATLFKPK